jgi:cysteine desulfuration protein SufE
MSSQPWPEALQEIIELFADTPQQDKLELLLEYAMRMPGIPPELQTIRDQMEPVPECQSPVYLFSKLDNGRVFYDIDVPMEAPTVRGFAGILHEGLNGATPEQIEATPNDLYERLGLNAVLSPQRVRGLAALLYRMKRRARDLTTAA